MKTIFKASMRLKDGRSHRVRISENADGLYKLTYFVGNEAVEFVQSPEVGDLLRMAHKKIERWIKE